jgi:uncharacterized membrane protein
VNNNVKILDMGVSLAVREKNYDVLTSHLYAAFLFPNPVEKWFGLVEFKNNTLGNSLHVAFFDFLFDNGLLIAPSDYNMFMDLRMTNAQSVLPDNFKCWVIDSWESLRFFQDSFLNIKEDAR